MVHMEGYTITCRSIAADISIESPQGGVLVSTPKRMNFEHQWGSLGFNKALIETQNGSAIFHFKGAQNTVKFP